LGQSRRNLQNHLTKSQQVYIEGRLQTRGWEDNNGTRHYRTELVANEMILLGDRHPAQEFRDDNDEYEDDKDSFPF
jgi:single-strand DNA-binding protein